MYMNCVLVSCKNDTHAPVLLDSSSQLLNAVKFLKHLLQSVLIMMVGSAEKGLGEIVIHFLKTLL